MRFLFLISYFLFLVSYLYAQEGVSWIISPKYQEVDLLYRENYYRFQKGGLWGVIHRDERIVIPAEYDDVYFVYSLMLLAKNDYLRLIDTTGREVNSSRYKYVLPTDYRLLKVENSEGLWGLLTERGDVVLKPKYTDLGGFSEGLSEVEGYNGVGYIDSTGREVIAVNPCWKPTLDSYFHEGYAVVKSCVWGRGNVIINKEGQEVLRGFPKRPSQGLLPVYGNGGWGFKNMQGELVIPYQYKAVGDFEKGWCVVWRNKYSKVVIDTLDNKITSPYNNIHIYRNLRERNLGGGHDILIRISSGDKKGYCDKNGQEIILPEYERLGLFWEGLAVAQKDGKVGAINIHNEVVIPFEYSPFGSKYSIDFNKNFSEDLLAVRKNISRSRKPHKAVYKWGFINKKNEVVIPFVFDEADSFWRGEARAKYEGKWGIIAHPFYTEWKKEQENKEEEAEAESGGK